ncbi:MAG: arginine--tRNA ligase [Campylobacter sputorum]|uniref:arginine--tRNA ligase n=1 Tax=Campylobacter sputorum TaxID=206 RepID=UPI000B796DD2|nr:arginine--tRNA ligase [Campylobacter sputorum]ASM38079.1 arginyl-tRNA synthetase [Campylobacter sputorum bv. paraureolyticus LMG 11764]MDY6121226.1 arginine--tRNA ligase [Campylobacter sputorum]
MKNIVLKKIKNILGFDVVLEKPKDRNLAHYASPVAFSLAKEMKKSPKIIAEELAKKFVNSDIFSEITAVNGYLNFKLSNNFLNLLALNALNHSSDFGKSDKKDEKILIEYISANPTGPLHIGHVRGAVYGDTLYRIGSHMGYDITTEYYINDAGNQIDLLGTSIILYAKDNLFNEKVSYPEKFYRGEYINELALKANELFGKEIFYDENYFEKLCLWAKDEVLKIIKKDLSDANISIQNWVSERGFYDKLDLTIQKLQKTGGMYEKDEKVWIKSSELGDEMDRVVIREDGRPTYLAGDIVYHNDKFERGFDRCINIWGADHHGYIKRMQSAIHFLGYDENKLEVILMQMVSLLKDSKPYKMSKRSGNVVLMSEVTQELGSDALRFIFVSKKNDTQLEFDIDSLKKQDSSNPIFYINYAHARINQVFGKANKNLNDVIDADFSNLSEDCKNLLFEALLLNEVLEDAFSSRQVQKLSDYLYALSSSFHKFYNDNRVVGSENENELLKLFGVVALCIKTGLSLMGIKAKDKMEH